MLIMLLLQVYTSVKFCQKLISTLSQIMILILRKSVGAAAFLAEIGAVVLWLGLAL